LFLLLSQIDASAHQRQFAIIKETNTALNSCVKRDFSDLSMLEYQLW